ncbi:ribonuclease P protein subunit p21 isoform X1 [Anas platyrhynchos]|uniref:ribonuclease P protein subunit p21 isoform X1 n=1 Tax=Anas platyrhynchos TaxID=8839 RepID=UPI003AF2018D
MAAAPAAHWVLPHSPALARFYCSTQRTAARRLVLRMAPAVKRAVCRRCCSLLLGCQRLRGGGAAPHRAALPDLRPPAPPPLPAQATPPPPGHAHKPRPRVSSTWQQRGDAAPHWLAAIRRNQSAASCGNKALYSL